jgi:hypothetical protein
MSKSLLEQVKEEYNRREIRDVYDLLYRTFELIPYNFKNNIRFDDESRTLYIGELEIGVLGGMSENEIKNVIEVDNMISYYQLRNIKELDFIRYDDMERKIYTRRLIFDSKNGEDFYELQDWIKCEIESDIVEDVLDDYNKYEYKNTDDNYSIIYNLVNTFETEWNSRGANLKYKIDIKDEGSEDYYLYLENTKICHMEDLLYCEVQADSIVYHLKDNKLLYIVIQWVVGNDAFINQIYIENEYDEDDCKILYEKE